MGLIEQTNSRLHFFRGMHLWPIEKELDFENWLENFKEGEDQIYTQIHLQKQYGLLNKNIRGNEYKDEMYKDAPIKAFLSIFYPFMPNNL